MKIKDITDSQKRNELEGRARAVGLDSNSTEAEVVAAEKVEAKHDKHDAKHDTKHDVKHPGSNVKLEHNQ